MNFIIFFVGIWSWLADKLHFILSYEAGFYKSTLPFSGLQHMQQCQINFQPIFDPGFISKKVVPDSLLSVGLN